MYRHICGCGRPARPYSRCPAQYNPSNYISVSTLLSSRGVSNLSSLYSSDHETAHIPNPIRYYRHYRQWCYWRSWPMKGSDHQNAEDVVRYNVAYFSQGVFGGFWGSSYFPFSSRYMVPHTIRCIFSCSADKGFPNYLESHFRRWSRRFLLEVFQKSPFIIDWTLLFHLLISDRPLSRRVSVRETNRPFSVRFRFSPV